MFPRVAPKRRGRRRVTAPLRPYDRGCKRDVFVGAHGRGGEARLAPTHRAAFCVFCGVSVPSVVFLRHSPKTVVHGGIGASAPLSKGARHASPLPTVQPCMFPRVAPKRRGRRRVTAPLRPYDRGCKRDVFVGAHGRGGEARLAPTHRAAFCVFCGVSVPSVVFLRHSPKTVVHGGIGASAPLSKGARHASPLPTVPPSVFSVAFLCLLCFPALLPNTAGVGWVRGDLWFTPGCGAFCAVCWDGRWRSRAAR